jgi:molecular chaperone GrpE (heat shock protein)
LAHYIQDLHLVTVLDELRDAYELSKEKGQSELQSQLLRIRRKLLDALHESLNLYAENAELHQQLGEAQAEIRQLRARGARSALTIETLPGRTTRKLS